MPTYEFTYRCDYSFKFRVGGDDLAAAGRKADELSEHRWVGVASSTSAEVSKPARVSATIVENV